MDKSALARPSTGIRSSRAVRWAALALAAVLCLWIHGMSHAQVIDEQVQRTSISEGIELITIRQFSTEGWLNIFALEVDRTQPHVVIDTLLGNDVLTAPDAVRNMAENREAVGAINGDFFYINASGTPLGPHVQSGRLVKSASGSRHLAFGISSDPDVMPTFAPFTARITALLSDGTVLAVDGWNDPLLGNGQIVLYNEDWASHAQGPDWPDLVGARDVVHVIVESGGRVVQILEDEETGPSIPKGGFILAGRGSGADRLLRSVHIDDIIETNVVISPGPEYVAVIGGNPVLLRDGHVMPGLSTDVHPRTAVGYSEDGKTAWLVVVDGRSPRSRGVSLPELARIMQSLGASEAINLDGGGSSTLVAKLPGSDDLTVQNNPSDGGERRVPNGLGVFVDAAAGDLSRLVLIPPPASNAYQLVGAEARVAPGANYTVDYAALDQLGNAVALDASEITWRVDPESIGYFAAPGVFVAHQTGQGELTASVQTDEGIRSASLPVRVIGRPVAVEMTPFELALEPGQEVALRLNAVDDAGFRAPLTADDVTWELRGDIGEIEGLLFKAAEDSASGAIVANFNGLLGSALVGIGGEPAEISDFEDTSRWRATVYPAEVRATMSFTTDPEFVHSGDQAVRLDYDFTTTTKTRAAYVQPSPSYIELPGRPLKIGLWVYGDGNGAWLRGQIHDRFNVMTPISFASNVDWVGWRYVEASIPEGIEYPILLRSVYVVETRTTSLYNGQVYFDGLVAVYAPDPDPAILPDVSPVRDPNNRPFAWEALDETARDEAYQFVVFGDSKVQAGAPGARGALLLERSIEEINRHDIAFSLFTGDLVENDSEAHYVFGKSYLDRLHAPYHFAVANHEIAGTNSFANFRHFFGATYEAWTYENSLVVKLNAARPGLRVSEPEQWPWLIELLNETEADNVFIYMHIPTVDPQPGGTTGWSDEVEVGLFEHLLATVVARGKNVYVFNGHVHGFARRANDGVQYLTTAGAGSSMYMPPNRGGFYHYTLVTVHGDDVWYEVIPLLDRIVLEAEQTHVAVGGHLMIQATGVAPFDAVRFPLTYPAQVRWSVEDEQVGTVDEATGLFTARSVGTTWVTVESAGLTERTQIVVTAQ